MVLHLYLSTVQLQLQQPGRAYASARPALALGLRSPALNRKALFRKGRAAYALRCFARAERDLADAVEHSGGSDEAAVAHALSDVRRRLAEQSTGWFDYAGLFRQKQASAMPRLGVADFVGQIEVRRVLGKNRGVVDAGPPAGEVLLEAVVAVYKADPEAADVHILALNFATNTADKTTQALAATKLVCRAGRSGSRLKGVRAARGNGDTGAGRVRGGAR